MVAASSSSSSSSASSSSSSTFPSLLLGKLGAAGRWKPGGLALRGRERGGRAAEREDRRRCGEAGRGIGARARGLQRSAAEGPATPEAEDKGRLVRPPGPAGSRRGPRGPAPPSGPRRRRSILFLLSGPGPGAQSPLLLPPGLPTRPLVGGGVGRAGRLTLPAPAPADVYL